MFLWELIFVLALALFLTYIVTGACRRCGPWDNAFIFFIILFFATWSIGVWIVPVGPVLFGFYWLPFLVIAVIISLLLAAVTPSKKPKTAKEAEEIAYEKVALNKALDIFFWFLIIVLLIALISGYWWIRPGY